MTFNDPTTAMTLLATRRSGKPRLMVAPGPDDACLRQLLTVATRVPDHGQLAPWRLVVIRDRAKFADLLVSRLPADASPRERQAAIEWAHMAPVCVAVLSTPVAHKITRWEQELSAGAVCTALVMAASASGFVAGWLTGWAAYDDAVCRALGGVGDARIAGFIFIGSPGHPLEERSRPAYDSVVSDWA